MKASLVVCEADVTLQLISDPFTIEQFTQQTTHTKVTAKLNKICNMY